jgi:hypothetical protein
LRKPIALLHVFRAVLRKPRHHVILNMVTRWVSLALHPSLGLLRDAKLYEIGAGTSEIRRILIGRELFEKSA